MSYHMDVNRLCGIISGTKFSSFPGGSPDIRVGDQLPDHAIIAVAQELLKNNVAFTDTNKLNEIHAHWICTYDHNVGETEVKCSHCGDTRDINGCYVTTQGESCYFEDYFCPACGATMDEKV